jgi:hypothetical protein
LFLLSEGLVRYPETSQIGSLSVEPAPPQIGFVAAAFEVSLNDEQRQAFVAREPEYKIGTAPFYALDHDDDNAVPLGEGVICLASHDKDHDIDLSSKPSSIDSVWHWPTDSGLLPLSMYLRHCLLAVQKAGGQPYESFLDDTYLSDRRTTLREYMKEYGEEVMASRPPAYFKNRYSG